MKLIMTLITHNEDDVLRENLEYHLFQGVDYFIVINHNSTDNTEKILSEYVEKGVVEVKNERNDGFYQSKWVTELARRAYTEYKADWVINNDSDEFWIPEGKGNIKDSLNKINPEVGILFVPRYDFHFRVYAQDSVFYQAMPFRDAEIKWNKCMHRGVSDILVGEGNHDASSKEMEAKGLTSGSFSGMKIFHYPIRTYVKYRKNIEEKSKAIIKNTEIGENLAWHWRKALNALNDNRFDEVIGEKILADEQLNWGIKTGKYIIDDTLAKYFYRMKGNKRFI